MKIKIPSLALMPHGGGRVLVEIANKLVEKGGQVEIITSNYPGSLPFRLDPRVEIKRLGPKTSIKAVCVFCYIFLAPFYMRGSNILANHFLTVIPSWVASFMSSRYIYLVQGVEDRFYNKLIHWPLRVVCRWTYRKGKIVAANEYLAKQLNKYGEILLTLRLGVSSIFFEKKLLKKIKKYDVVYFLRPQALKRLDRFEKILDKLAGENLEILCISQDSELLQRYSTRVNTCMPKNDFELIDLMDESKILLLTSDYEGFALPPLECMARGLPAILYECGGPSLYTKDGDNAYIIKDNTEEEQAVDIVIEKLKLLLADQNKYNEMSINARGTAVMYRMDDAVNEFVNYIEEYFEV